MKSSGPAKAAVLVVDVQVDVIRHAWRPGEVVTTIAGLVDRARANGRDVIWVRHNHPESLPLGSDGWQIVPELRPAVGEPIVEKMWGDAFADTDLQQVCRSRGIGRLVICGAMSNQCVNATMYGALYRGYDVTLVEDGHTAEDQEFDDPRVGEVRWPAQDVVVWQNMMAHCTRLPDVTCGIAKASHALDLRHAV